MNTSPDTVETMEQACALVQQVVEAYCRPRLYRRGPTQLLGWELGFVTDGTNEGPYQLTFMPKHETAPCRNEPRPSTVYFRNLRFGVTRASVTNALFHALSWPGSPYWFDGKWWDRKTAIYG